MKTRRLASGIATTDYIALGFNPMQLKEEKVG
jgi:hypothetical protein